MTENINIHEREIQNKILQLLADPSIVFDTLQGKRLQVLSPGKINTGEGPDFKNIALMIDGDITIGDAEFHRDSKEWYQHKHDNNKNYDKVILHIVFKFSGKPDGIETLILPEEQVMAIELQEEEQVVDLDSIEDLQHYSLKRLLRKSSEIQVILNNNSLQYTVEESVRSFLERYFSRKRRPVYTSDLLSNILEQLRTSFAFKFLTDIENENGAYIPDQMQMLMRSKISSEGSALRREIILNCILPLSLCLANTESRINLLFWYWSTPSLTEYGVLTRKFPNIPQNFLWQQQGMLEFLNTNGNRDDIHQDASHSFGFANVLGFYKKS